MTLIPNIENSSEVRAHHPFSPSSLQCREACPKYVPQHSENEASLMGTIQHAAVDSEMDDERMPDYRAMAVAECIRYSEERAKNYPGGRVLREVYLPIDDEVLVIDVRTIEQFDIVTDDGQVSPGFRGKLTRVIIDHTTAGYLDFAVISADGKRAEIIDWKFGRNAVTKAEDNLQGISYMLGLRKMFPTIETVSVRFCQPHIDHETEHTFDLPRITEELYLRVKTVVHRAVDAANRPDDFSMARANVGTCIFCALVGKCPKVGELMIKVGKKFAPLVVPADISTTSLNDPARVSEGLKLAQVTQVWAEAYRRQATAQSISADDFVPEGYILVSTQKCKILKPRDVGKIAKEFLPEEDHGKVEALYDLSLTPLDKLISTRAPRGQKEATVEEFRNKIVAEGAAEMGSPFAFLRQATDKDSGKTAAK